MTANTYGRQVVLPLTNKSGGSVAAGDVVIVDTTNNDAFTTTTTTNFTGALGVAQETIANNAIGRVLLSGYAALVNVNASVTRGHYGATYSVAKQATDAGTSRASGTFCQFLTGGTTPDAMVWQPDLGSSSGLTHSTVGTTSVGGSFDTRGMKIKKVTLASAGLVSAIWAHMKSDGSGNPQAVMPVIYSDTTGNPINLILSPGAPVTATPVRVNSAILNTTARWMGMPVGMWLAAGDYWIGVWLNDGASVTQIAYASGAGSDRTVSASLVNQPVDSSVQAISTGTNDYSIYADILR